MISIEEAIKKAKDENKDKTLIKVYEWKKRYRFEFEETVGEDTDEGYTISKRTGKSEIVCFLFDDDDFICTIEV